MQRTARYATTAAALAAMLLLATSCGGDDDKAEPVKAAGPATVTPDPPKASTPAAAAVPAYTVINESKKTVSGKADLVVPDATVDQAQAAIRDYAKGIGGGLKDVSVTVVRAADAKVYVCSGRWIKDEAASKLYTGGSVKADKWPTIAMNCPDPGGKK
ncbi:hypothetical protein B4N89_13535 [Embleya scabrispora]|uniref:PASTA domain-containing protein n=1 Tax=Embleya scabrispora TaxID=159449 RepID=A0A1T3NYP3_9ACTN|nr:hypothetical protein [Embleya scabrispora]OPC81822.1 hypothetical protein B4N89_13535 [Embleya scabrispora]